MKILINILDFITKKECYLTVLSVIIGVLFYKACSSLLERLIITGKTDFEKKKRKTIVKLFKNIFKYSVITIVILFLLNLYGYNVKTLIAGLGIVATVLGLALQDTIKDFIGGITILLENYYVAGDIIKYNNFTGEVIDFTLKCTKVKAFNGEVMILSNRNVNEVINLSQKQATLMIKIPVAYETKVEKIEKVILETILPETNDVEFVIKNSQKYLGISELADSSVNYLICVDCKQEHQWQVNRDILRIILLNLNKNKIKIPYQQIEVYNAENKIK